MQPQQIQFEATKELTVVLQAQEWGVVLEALGDMSFKRSAPLIQKLQQQFEAAAAPGAPTNGAHDPAAALPN